MERKGWMKLEVDRMAFEMLRQTHQVCAWCGRELIEKAISVVLSTEGLDSNPNDWGLSKDDKELEKDLWEWRETIARERGLTGLSKGGAIISNEAMRACALLRPRTIPQLRRIRGISKSKADRYGKTILKIVSKGMPPIGRMILICAACERDAPKEQRTILFMGRYAIVDTYDDDKKVSDPFGLYL